MITFTLTDPPYGVGLSYDGYFDSMGNLKNLVAGFMPELRRLSDLSIITPGVNALHLYPASSWICCWYIEAGMSAARNNWGFSCWQPILVYGKPKRELYSDVVKHMEGADRDGAKFHPCPKPYHFWRKLMLWGIREQHEQGIIRVLDPFSGSGTTAFAAQEFGIHFLGIEQNPRYAQLSREKLVLTRSDLFTMLPLADVSDV